MRVGILGSGLMGGKLGTLFARAGHEVVFSYARSDAKLKRLAREAEGNAPGRHPGRGGARRRRRCCWRCTGLVSTTCWSRPAISRAR